MTLTDRLAAPFRSYAPISVDRAIDILQRRQDGYTNEKIALYLGVSMGEVEAFMRRMKGVLVNDWRLECMTADEFETYTDRGTYAHVSGTSTPRPCDDCPAAFASIARTDGICNGTRPGETV